MENSKSAIFKTASISLHEMVCTGHHFIAPKLTHYTLSYTRYAHVCRLVHAFTSAGMLPSQYIAMIFKNAQMGEIRIGLFGNVW